MQDDMITKTQNIKCFKLFVNDESNKSELEVSDKITIESLGNKANQVNFI